MSCKLAQSPHDCFARYQDSLLQKRNRHSWESIGECHGCKLARVNAEIAHLPEQEGLEPRQTEAHIDSNDFLESRPAVNSDKRGRKPTTRCKQGHPYAKHGRKRNDGGYRCRICDAAKRLQRYHAKKAK